MTHQTDVWRETYAERAQHGAWHRAPLLVGARGHYLMEEGSDRPMRDFTGGNGIMPLGHGHQQVGDSIVEMAKYFYQTGPWAREINGVEMEYLKWLSNHFRDVWRFQFFSCENEALRCVPEAIGVPEERVAWLNREPPVGMRRASAFGSESRAVVICPINPVTHEKIDAETLEDVSRRHRKIVWDETVTGMGWSGVSPFQTPYYSDAVVLGGALGGGIPLGAIGGAATRPVQGDRTGGSALAFTAGLHVLRQVMVLTSNSDAAAVIERLDDELDRLASLYSAAVRGVTGMGLLRGLRFQDDTMVNEFLGHCRDLGLLLDGSGKYVRIAVPLVCGLQDVDDLVNLVGKALERVNA